MSKPFEMPFRRNSLSGSSLSSCSQAVRLRPGKAGPLPLVFFRNVGHNGVGLVASRHNTNMFKFTCGVGAAFGRIEITAYAYITLIPPFLT